jgi:hypothetical protein
MPVLYNQIPIVPAPFVTITPQTNVTGDGTKLGHTFNIVLHGKIVAVPPGTSAISQDARLGVILSKQKALYDQFSVDGKILEFYSPDGTGIIKCNPLIKNGPEFQEGIWTDVCEYTITLEASLLYDVSNASDEAAQFVDEASDNWDITESGTTFSDSTDDVTPMWRLNHVVSAKGKRVFDATGSLTKQAWEQARDWVVARLTSSPRPINTQGELSLGTYQYFNPTRVETINELDGTFSATDTLIMTQNNTATEELTVSIRYSPEDQYVHTTIALNGVIRGLTTNVNDPSGRITNALSYFNGIKPNLFTRASHFLPDITLNQYGSGGSIDYNYAEGTITFSYEYTDRPSTGLVYDNYTIEKKISLDTPETVVTVSGTITGRLMVGEFNANLIKYIRAKQYWDGLLAGNTIWNRASSLGVNGLQPTPVDDSVAYDIFQGTVNYTYVFNNRLYNTVRNEYTVSTRFNVDDNSTTVTVDGTIQGLRTADTDPILQRYTNALAFWQTWQPQLPSIASNFLGATLVPLNTTPLSQSRGDNNLQGSIQYSVEYKTMLPVDIPNALTENIESSDGGGTDVFAVIPVLGRAAGPVMQSIGTIRERTRTLNIEAVIKMTFPKPNTNAIVATYAPSGTYVFKERDEETWNPRINRYSRQVQWIYEI